MTNKEKYENLLEEILKNSESLKDASIVLLEKSLEKNNYSNKLTFVAYAQNLMFASIDEIGKFYLIKSLYPKKIEDIILKDEGFERHDTKIKILIERIKEYRGKEITTTQESALKIIRMLKNNTLYINYKSGKIIKPSNSSTLSSKQFPHYIQLLISFSNMANIDLKLFKRQL